MWRTCISRRRIGIGRCPLPMLDLVKIALRVALIFPLLARAELFNGAGEPTANAQKMLAADGLRLISGKDIDDVVDAFLGKGSCVTVIIAVGVDGLPKKYTLVDGVTRDQREFKDITAELIAMLNTWKFQPIEKEVLFPFTFGVATSFPEKFVTRFGNESAGPKCSNPTVKVDKALANGATLLHEDHAYYPFPASPARLSGCLLVEFDVTPEGLTDNYEVLATDLPKRFTNVSVGNLNSWRFKPAVINSRSMVRFVYQTDRDIPPATPVCSRPMASSPSIKP